MLKKKSTRLKNLTLLIDKNKEYPYESAILLLKKTSTAKFDESFEIILKLKILFKNQVLKSWVLFPGGNPKKISIGVLTNKPEEALNLKAALAGNESLLSSIVTEKFKPTVLLCMKDFFPQLTAQSKYNKILGRKGLMPSESTETVVEDLKASIDEFYNKGKTFFKIEKDGIIRMAFGNQSFSNKRLELNMLELFHTLKKSKLIALKTAYSISKVLVKSTQGPAIRVDIASIKEALSKQKNDFFN